MARIFNLRLSSIQLVVISSILASLCFSWLSSAPPSASLRLHRPLCFASNLRGPRACRQRAAGGNAAVLTRVRHPRASEPPPWSSTPPLACFPEADQRSRATLLVSADKLDEILEAHIAAAGNDHHFFFVWASPWKTWRPVHDLFVQSLFAHNADALVVCIMSDLAGRAEPHPLSVYAALGYKIVGIHVPLGVGGLSLPPWWTSDSTRAWLSALDPASNTLAYTHSSDYFRFYLLYRYGGCYTDVDAIFLRTLPPGGFIGADWSKNTISWFFDEEQHIYLAPGVLRASRRGLPVLRTLLERTFNLTSYDASCFNCVGPKAINLALQSESGDTFGTIYNAMVLYPSSFLAVSSLFDDSTAAVPMLVESLRRRSISAHLFGHTSQGFPIHPASAVAYIGESFALSRILRPTPTPEEAAVPIITELSTLTSSSSCSLGGQSREAPPGLVAISNSMTLRDGNLVLVRNCDSLEIVLRGGGFVKLRIGVLSGGLRSTSCADATCAPASENDGACLLFSGLSSLADINRALASVTYLASGSQGDDLTIRLIANDVDLLRETLSIYVLARLVTIVTHTHGRLGSVQRMHDSIQAWYPGTRLLVSDDSGTDKVRSGLGNATFASVLQLPFDTGLSAGRNALISSATTPYVFLLDDDFTVGESTHLDYLLRVLEADAPGGRFHFASAVIPADAENFAFHFRGLMATSFGDLTLSPGAHGTVYGCTHVDFVPNVFLARRATLQQVRWDPDLKLGEHEEFFLRAKRFGVRILSCDNSEVQHHQLTWWTGAPSVGEEDYVEKRKRVYDFFKLSLRKSGLKRLISFGTVMANIDS